MAESLLGFLIYLVLIIVVAALVLWAVRQWLPEAYTPARLIVGAVALIAVLVLLLRLFQAGAPALP
jgi:hypothetical protein